MSFKKLLTHALVNWTILDSNHRFGYNSLFDVYPDIYTSNPTFLIMNNVQQDKPFQFNLLALSVLLCFVCSWIKP